MVNVQKSAKRRLSAEVMRAGTVRARSHEGKRRVVCFNELNRRIGESHGRAKFSDADIELIHQLREAGLSYGAIASKFDHIEGGIGKSTVRDICTGRIRGQYAVRFKACA